MEKTKNILILKITAILLGAFLVGHELYYLVQQWHFYVDYGTPLFNIATGILKGSLIVILISLILNKITLSIGAFCIYFIATILNVIPYFQWENIFTGNFQKYHICLIIPYFINLLILISLLLFLRKQISARFSIILITIFSLCKLFVSWASSYFFYTEVASESIKSSINIMQDIFSRGTLLSIAQLVLMILCIILYTKSKRQSLTSNI